MCPQKAAKEHTEWSSLMLRSDISHSSEATGEKAENLQILEMLHLG